MVNNNFKFEDASTQLKQILAEVFIPAPTKRHWCLQKSLRLRPARGSVLRLGAKSRRGQAFRTSNAFPLKYAVPITSDDQAALRRSLLAYRVLGPVVAALLAPFFLRRLIKRGGYKAHFYQRFGFFTPSEQQRLRAHCWTWIRSISVGETIVALKLAKALKRGNPAMQIALSVTTSTGFELAAAEASEWLFVFYNPVDFQGVVRRVMEHLNPQKLILIEGEIWPNLMSACAETHVPVMLANARLSPRSARRFAKFKVWTSPFFKMLSWVAIPDESDRPRWESIGVPKEHIHLTGSIKFDQVGNGPERKDAFASLLQQSGMGSQEPLLIAGSTHDGEEEILVQALKTWRKKNPLLRMLVAPRHVERVPEILRTLAPLGVKIIRRTSLPSSEPWDVILLDTTGELRDWYPLSTVVFIGKSLAATGGQNPVEPALCGKPVVFGPHMENFESIVHLLLARDAALQANSKAHMEQLIAELLSDSDRRKKLGENAESALGVHQGSTQKTAALVQQTPGQQAKT